MTLPAATVTLESQIDRLISEIPLTMSAAAAFFGKGVHRSTPARYALKGCLRTDGTRVHLEAIRIGNKLVTSRPAITRFLALLNETLPVAAAPPAPTHRRKSKASIEMDRVLSLTD